MKLSIHLSCLSRPCFPLAAQMPRPLISPQVLAGPNRHFPAALAQCQGGAATTRRRPQALADDEGRARRLEPHHRSTRAGLLRLLVHRGRRGHHGSFQPPEEAQLPVRVERSARARSGLPWELSDAPRGRLHRHFYHSAIVGDDRDFYVYTPATYEGKSKQKFPVLYLQHGFSDDASGWTAVGRANVIMDNLIAQGKAKPMLVVMRLGYGAPEILKPDFSGFRDADRDAKFRPVPRCAHPGSDSAS